MGRKRIRRKLRGQPLVRILIANLSLCPSCWRLWWWSIIMRKAVELIQDVAYSELANNKEETLWKEPSLRVGSRFNRKDVGSLIVPGICRCQCISRQYMTWFLVISWLRWLGQDFDFPGSQPRRHRIHWLRSARDTNLYVNFLCIEN